MMVALVAFALVKSLKNQVASLSSNSGVCVLETTSQVIENIGGGSGVCSGAPPIWKVVALVASPYRGRHLRNYRSPPRNREED